MKTKFVERLKEEMELREIRQIDLAQRTGISKVHIHSYLSGRNLPKQRNLFLISECLDVSPSYLMGWTNDKKTATQEEQPLLALLKKHNYIDNDKELTPNQESAIRALIDSFEK